MKIVQWLDIGWGWLGVGVGVSLFLAFILSVCHYVFRWIDEDIKSRRAP